MRASRLALVFAMTSSACPAVVSVESVDAGSGAGVQPAHLVAADALPSTRELGGPLPTSQLCAQCHSSSDASEAMRDFSGTSVAPYDLWRASLMANAARDPIFLAQVAAETQHAPPVAGVIETTCFSCHSPLLYRERLGETEAPTIRMAELFATDDDAARALDGVSCAACHRIAPQGLGTPATFNGQWRMETDGVIYGPYPAPFTPPMENLGYAPTEGAHMRDSALCGTCHTLTVHALRPDGSETGAVFDEQMTFLEYRATDSSQTCQSCHMPTRSAGALINTAIARGPDGTDYPEIGPRTPYGKHTFVGGNELVLAMLRDEPTLGAEAPPEAFDALIEEVRALMTRAATVFVGNVRRENGSIVIPVTARALTAHKLPTGYPSRRLVLHVRVLDANGQVILESGRMDVDGRVLDAQGVPLPGEGMDGLYLPHVDVIASDTDVQIWEEVPGDEVSLPTTTLLASNVMLKDNRLLPSGFDTQSEDGQRVKTVGVEDDNDFGSSGDTVDVVVPDDPQLQPARIEVELRYQTLSPRWREGLLQTGTPWALALEDMFTRQDMGPKVLAQASADL